VNASEFNSAVTDLILEKTGMAVFSALANAIGSLYPGSRGAFACPDSWRTYALYYSGAEEGLILDGNEWKQLQGAEGWNGKIFRIAAFGSGGESITAFPLMEGSAVIGFAGWLHAIGSKPPESAVVFLRTQIEMLQRFTAKRVSLSRKEAFKKMTDDAFAKSDRRFRDLIEESRDMIYITDAAGIITLVNRAAEDLLGMPVNEILGKPLVAFCPFVTDMDFFNETMEKHGFVRDFELILMNRAGETVFVTESATAVIDDHGNTVEIHGIIRDITERLSDQRELWKANMDLVALNETLKKTQLAMVQQEKLASIGQLAAGIAHEINNPLGFIMSDFGVLKKAAIAIASITEMANRGDVEGIKASTVFSRLDFLSKEMPDMLSEMDDGFQRIAEIVKNLRSFSRIDESGAKLDCNINDCIEQSLIIARNELKYSVDVVKRCAAVPPVPANPGEIKQVFLNLIVNAAQAIAAQKRQEHGRIEISTGSAGDMVWAEIEDDGPGIDEHAAKRLFEPFFTTKEPGSGTGLGLSISYDIITRKHNGTLSFHPGETSGTVFRIELPLGAKA